MANDRVIELLIKAKDEAHGVLSGHMAKLDELTQKHLNLSLKAAAAYAAVVAGAVAAAAEVYKFADRMAELGDAMDEMSIRTNMSVESLSKWGYVLGKEGATIQEFESATRRLARAMYDADRGAAEQAEAFARLGVNIKDSNGQLIDINEAMLRVSDGLMRMGDETERTALMQVLLGRGGGNLAVALYQGRDAITAQMQELQKMGGVMTGEFAAAAANFEDAQARMKAAMDGVKMKAAEPLFDPFAATVDNATLAVRNLGGALEWYKGIFDKLPQGTGAGVINAMGLGFMLPQNRPAAATVAPASSPFDSAAFAQQAAMATWQRELEQQMQVARDSAIQGSGIWSPMGGAVTDDFELGNLLSGADDINAVLKEASTHSIVLKDTIAEVGDTGQQSAQMIGQAMASALEQAIFEARDLDDILGGLARTFISLGLSAVLTPGAGFLGLEQGGGIPHAAYGMSVRGGIPGMDSVPIMAQAGEEVLDRTLSYELRNFLAQVQGGGVAATGAARVAGPVSITQQFAFPVRESDRRAVGRHARIAVQEAGRDYL